MKKWFVATNADTGAYLVLEANNENHAVILLMHYYNTVEKDIRQNFTIVPATKVEVV